MTASTVAARVAAFRERRAALGLTRLDVYAHRDDHEAIKAYAARLANRRRRAAANDLSRGTES